MKIWRKKSDGKLYTLTHVRPPKILGSWYEATPYKWESAELKKLRPRKQLQEYDIEKEFDLVSEGSVGTPVIRTNNEV